MLVYLQQIRDARQCILSRLQARLARWKADPRFIGEFVSVEAAENLETAIDNAQIDFCQAAIALEREVNKSPSTT